MRATAGKLPSRDDFSHQIDSIFQARTGEGAAFDLRLVQFEDHVFNATQDNFSLLFQAPSDAPAMQSLYRLDHETLGEMDIFLVPVKKDENGLYYEAVFNLLIGM